MKCFSCSEEINEKFQYALSQNVCPFCGKAILSEDDYFFRKSLDKILKNHGIDTKKASEISKEIVNLLEGPSPAEIKETKPAEVIEVPVVGEYIGSVQSGGSSVPANATLNAAELAQKVANKKPPKRIGFKSEGAEVSTRPLAERIAKVPSQSMDVSGIEEEVGAPSPEEEAEIQAEIDSGKILLTPLVI